MRAARWAILSAIPAFFGCFLFGGGPEAPPPAAPALGTFQRLSDVDPILDLAVGGDSVWLATTTGLVRHPLAGGEVTRIGEADGLPSPDVTAVVASDTEGWAATTFGLVKLGPEGMQRIADTPEIGVATALAIDQEGALWMGGAQGLGRGKDGTWKRWSDRYKVTSLAPDTQGLWIGTKDGGVVRLANGVFSEHTISIGVPSNFVRTVVPLGGGQALALCQSPSGSSLGHWDGSRWWSYTVPGIEEPLVGLAVVGGKAHLATPSRVFVLERDDDADGTELIALAEGGEGAPRQFRPRPEAVQPGGAPPPPPPEAPATPAATTPAPAAAPPPPAPPPAAASPTKRGPSAGPTAPPPAAPAPAADIIVPEEPAPATPQIVMPQRDELPAPLRPLPPPEAEHDAPRWVMRDAGVAAGAKISLIRGKGDALWVATIGLGVSRFQGGRETSYRTGDLAATDRPFFLGWDPQGNSWLLTKAGDLAKFDGEQIARQAVDPDPTVRPVAVAPGAGAVLVLARVGDTNVFRVYRAEGGSFRSLVERELVAGEGVGDPSLFAVDPSGRFWVGIKAKTERGTFVERGVAVIDPNSPTVTYHHSRAAAETDGPGALRIPDSLSSVAFAPSGDVWLAGLEGAVRITSAGEVTRFGEAQGLEGELVGDIDMGPGNMPYIATPAGVGHYDGSTWQFSRNSVARQARPIAVAIDGQGQVWAGGPHGAIYGTDRTWKRLGMAQGLLNDRLTDIRVDGNNRVWFVSASGLTVLSRN